MDRRLIAILTLVLLLSAGLSEVAFATVSISRAELKDSRLRIEGQANANRDITVDGVVMGRSDGSGEFRIERDDYTPPADCTVDVNDGSASATTVTLSGCTVRNTPTPTPTLPPPTATPSP
ncbi:MAG: hypothetical protein M3220_04050, partial [Chloroflexota bacterium]|nr:hypothetical protein [Chloroflexota bacterium]